MERWQDKVKGLRCGKVSLWGKLREAKGRSVRFVMQTQVGAMFSSRSWLSLVLKSQSPFPGMETGRVISFTTVNLFFTLRQEVEGQRVPLVSAVS